MLHNRILLPHQYFYPHMDLIEDRANGNKREDFLNSLKEIREPQPSMLYIHIPFCDSHCAFCGFDKEYDLKQTRFYVDRIKEELKYYASPMFPIHGIHFGGGTPTILPGELLQEVIDTVHENYTILPDAQINLEGSCTTLYRDDIIELIKNKKNNITRVSTGVQTFQPALREEYHQHATLEDVYRTLNTLKQNDIMVYIDILYCYPDFGIGEQEEMIQKDLNEAARMGVDGVEFGSMFPYANELELIVRRRNLKMPTTQEAVRILTKGMETLEANGYEQQTSYVFSRKGRVLLENDYYGGLQAVPNCIACGSGALGNVNGWKYRNSSYPVYKEYNLPTFSQLKKMTQEQIENMSIVGFPKNMWLHKSLLTPALKDRFQHKLDHLLELGMITDQGDRYRVERCAMPFVDNLYYYMIPEIDERQLMEDQLKLVVLEDENGNLDWDREDQPVYLRAEDRENQGETNGRGIMLR